RRHVRLIGGEDLRGTFAEEARGAAQKPVFALAARRGQRARRNLSRRGQFGRIFREIKLSRSRTHCASWRAVPMQKLPQTPCTDEYRSTPDLCQSGFRPVYLKSTGLSADTGYTPPRLMHIPVTSRAAGRGRIFQQGGQDVRHEKPDEIQETGRAGPRSLQGICGVRRSRLCQRRDSTQV